MLLAVDKPSWITSYDAIRALKKVFWKEKIGHSGTLDPMASGLLLIGVGKGTKRLAELQGLDKSYTTTIDFSKQSDTWDLDYWEYFQEYPILPPLERGDQGGIKIWDTVIPAPKIEYLTTLLDKLIPEYSLPLTPFSAKKKDGKKLYELARAGEVVNESRIMKVNSYAVLDYTFPELKLELDVGSGTYIRSIGHRLGEKIKKLQDDKNFWGILTSLRRKSIWNYNLENISLEKSVARFDKKTEKEYTIHYQIVEE